MNQFSVLKKSQKTWSPSYCTQFGIIPDAESALVAARVQRRNGCFLGLKIPRIYLFLIYDDLLLKANPGVQRMGEDLALAMMLSTIHDRANDSTDFGPCFCWKKKE